MKKIIPVILIAATATSATAADMPRNNSAITTAAIDYAQAKMFERSCQSVGAVLNGAYWQNRLAQLGGRSKAVNATFKRVVPAQMRAMQEAINQQGRENWCDDVMDQYSDRYGSTASPPFGNGGAALPACWDDGSGLYACSGVRSADPLAILDDIDGPDGADD